MNFMGMGGELGKINHVNMGVKKRWANVET